MISYRRLNRFATLAILPIMAITVVIVLRSARDSAPAPVARPTEGLLVAANLRDESLAVDDLTSGAASRTLQLAGPPHELVEAGGRVYATLGRGNALVEVEPNAPGVLRSLPLEGEPHGLALDGSNLFVTLDTASALVTVDRATLSERARAATGDTPHVVATASGKAIVTESRANRVAETWGRSAPTGAMPEGIAVTGRFVVTADANGGTVTIIDRDTFVVAGTVKVGGQPVRLLTLDDSRVLVALNASAKVAVVNVATRKVERQVAVDARPDGICLSPSGAYVAVASNATGTLAIFRLADWAPAGTLANRPGLGSCLWLARN